MKSTTIAVIAAVLIVVIAASIVTAYVNCSKEKDNKKGITLIDDEGNKIILTSVPQRIVSLAPSCTQIAFAIGLGDKVVGVTTADDYPYNFSAWAATGNITLDGDYGNPNMETISSLRPDLIITDNINDANLPYLRSEGYNILVLNPVTIKGICKDITLLGNATNEQTKANILVTNITGTINSIATKIADAHVAKLKVFYEMWEPPNGGSYMTVANDTWINEVITKAGGVNIFSNTTGGYITLPSETIVTLNPEAIFLPTKMGEAPFYGSISQVKITAGWNVISAVQHNRIYIVD